MRRRLDARDSQTESLRRDEVTDLAAVHAVDRNGQDQMTDVLFRFANPAISLVLHTPSRAK